MVPASCSHCHRTTQVASGMSSPPRCKWVTRRELSAKNPEMMDAKLRFLRMDGPDNEMVLAFPLNGQMQVVNIGFNVYEDARGILGRNPSIRPEAGFAQVDAAWLDRFFR